MQQVDIIYQMGVLTMKMLGLFTLVLLSAFSVAHGQELNCAKSADPTMCVLDKSEPAVRELLFATANTYFVPAAGCKDASITVFEQKAARLEGIISEQRAMARRQPTADLSFQVMKMVNLNTSTLVNIRLEIADHAFRSGCIDFADVQYRTVLKNYSGPGLETAQRRALVGIEDVRRARPPVNMRIR